MGQCQGVECFHNKIQLLELRNIAYFSFIFFVCSFAASERGSSPHSDIPVATPSRTNRLRYRLGRCWLCAGPDVLKCHHIPTISLNIVANKQSHPSQWAIKSQPQSFHIPANKSSYYNNWATISHLMNHHISANKPSYSSQMSHQISVNKPRRLTSFIYFLLSCISQIGLEILCISFYIHGLFIFGN